MYIKQLSVFLQNKPGHLAEITDILKNDDIDIRAINVSEGNDFGILRMLVDDTYKAQYLLNEQGYLCKISDVLAIEPEDKVGAMNKIFRALADNDININYIYSIIRPYHEKAPVVVLMTSDQDKAIKVIENIDIPFITEEQIVEVEPSLEGKAEE